MTDFVPLSKEEDVLPLLARKNLASIRSLNLLEAGEKAKFRDLVDRSPRDAGAESISETGFQEGQHLIKRQKLELALSTHAVLEKELNSLEKGVLELQALLDQEGTHFYEDEDKVVIDKIESKIQVDLNPTDNNGRDNCVKAVTAIVVTNVKEEMAAIEEDDIRSIAHSRDVSYN